jgi:predicted RNase H-like HicB family nuclease
MQKISAVIYPDAGSDWLIAYNPETGTTTQGKSPAQALANLKEATGLYLQEFPMSKKRRTVLTAFTLKTAQA